MAKPVQRVTLGIDVSLDTLDIHRSDTDEVVTISNDAVSIKRYLKSLPPAQFGVEPTNHYHQPLVDLAVQLGHVVYLIDPKRLNKYREAVGHRAKTDAVDARLL